MGKVVVRDMQAKHSIINRLLLRGYETVYVLILYAWSLRFDCFVKRVVCGPDHNAGAGVRDVIVHLYKYCWKLRQASSPPLCYARV